MKTHSPLARLACGLATFVLCASASHTGAQAPAETANDDREALRRAADALVAFAQDPENTDQLVFPLVHQTKIIGRETEEIQVRYRNKIVVIPVYKHYYEEQEVIIPVKEGSVTVMKKVKRRVRVRSEKVGEKKVQRLVRDPDGDIVKTHTKVTHIRGPGGPAIQSIGWTGRNAMAMYALLEAGVTPENTPIMQDMAWALETRLTRYGLPDDTYDLAWAVAALSRYPDATYESTVHDLIAKLLAGQSESTKHRGMWGPVCVSPSHLRAVIKEYDRVEAAAKKLEEVRARARGEDLSDLENELQGAREQVATMFNTVTRNGIWFSLATRSWTISGEEGEDISGLIVAGWPYSVYQHSMSDLQSTAIVAFALRVAYENNVLNESYTYNKLRDVQGKPLAKPIQTMQVLTQTAQSLVALRDGEQGWNECITWEQSATFRRLNEIFKGEPVQIPKEIQSRSTPINNAQAAAALSDLIAVLGEPAEKRFGEPARAAQSLVGQGTGPVFEHIAALPNQPHHGNRDTTLKRFRVFEPIAGGELEPYAFFDALRLSTSTIKEDANKQKAYEQMLAWLVDRQLSDGLWPVGELQTWVSTPALRAYAAAHVEQITANPTNQRNAIPIYALQKITPGHQLSAAKHEDRRLAAVYAMMALSRAGGPLESYTPPPLPEPEPEDLPEGETEGTEPSEDGGVDEEIEADE